MLKNGELSYYKSESTNNNDTNNNTVNDDNNNNNNNVNVNESVCGVIAIDAINWVREFSDSEECFDFESEVWQ